MRSCSMDVGGITPEDRQSMDKLIDEEARLLAGLKRSFERV